MNFKKCSPPLFVPMILFAASIQLLLPNPTHAQEPLILGIHPYLSTTEITKRFGPLAEHVGKELDRPVTIHVESSYESHVAVVGKGKVDIAFMGPAAYTKMVDKYGKRPVLAAFETTAGRVFSGFIIVRKDSPIQTLSQLRGKKFAFGPPPSTMGNLIPRFMLLKVGIDLKDLGEVEFLTNHVNIALAVLSGKFDAGAVKGDIFKEYEPQGLRALAVSDPVPDHLFLAREGLPEDIVMKVSNVLRSLKDTEQGRRILSSIQKDLIALVPARDADYDPLRKVLDSLEKAGVKQ